MLDSCRNQIEWNALSTCRTCPLGLSRYQPITVALLVVNVIGAIANVAVSSNSRPISGEPFVWFTSVLPIVTHSG